MDGPHSNNITIVTDNGNHTSTDQFFYKVHDHNVAHVILPYQLAEGNIGSGDANDRPSFRGNCDHNYWREP